jgi:hypothetical protein
MINLKNKIRCLFLTTQINDHLHLLRMPTYETQAKIQFNLINRLYFLNSTLSWSIYYELHRAAPRRVKKSGNYNGTIEAILNKYVK